jgi:hypothetical protein
MKILVLVIASDHTQQYIDMQAVWRSQIKKCSFDVWFVKSMSENMWIWDDDFDALSSCALGIDDASSSVGIDDASRTIFIKQDETYIPGILNKTIVAINYFMNKYPEYTHIWRTNLSSVIDFDGMLQFIQSDIGRRCSYAGFKGINDFTFASGAGFLMIREAALYLVKNHSLVLSWDLIDDVAIGRLLCPIFGLTHIERLWIKIVDEPIRDAILDKGIFHFRCETHNHSNTVSLMQNVCDVINSINA